MAPRRSKVRRAMRPTTGTPPPATGDIRSRRTGTPCRAAAKEGSGRSSVQFLRNEIEQDRDGIPYSLAFGQRIGGVIDGDRNLHIAQPAFRDLDQNFRSMGHAVLPQPDGAWTPAGKGAQAGMGVRE